jgi:hypothetical protein
MNRILTEWSYLDPWAGRGVPRLQQVLAPSSASGSCGQSGCNLHKKVTHSTNYLHFSSGLLNGSLMSVAGDAPLDVKTKTIARNMPATLADSVCHPEDVRHMSHLVVLLSDLTRLEVSSGPAHKSILRPQRHSNHFARRHAAL